MAVVKMEKLKLTFRAEHLDQVLHIMQGFQGVQIDDDFDNEVPPQQRSEIEGSIREIERTLQNIHTACGILNERKSANIFSSLTSGAEAMLTIKQLEQAVEQSNWQQITQEVIKTDRQRKDNRSRRQEITDLLGSLELWEVLESNPLDFKKLIRTGALFGSVHEIHSEEFVQELSAYADKGLYYARIAHHDDREYLLILYHNSIKESIRMLLGKFSFSAEKYPFDKPQKEMRKALEAEDAALAQEETAIDEQIQLQTQYEELLNYSEDHFLNLLLRKRKALEVASSADMLEINGWIIADKSKQFEKTLAKHLPKDAFHMTLSDVAEKDAGKVPILLKNNRVAKAFEQLTEMYSLPKYNEVDPTPVMTVFYILFFGMMVADAGYGLAILAVTFIARRFLHVKRGTKNFMDFLYYLSFSITGWGLVYGSFCGFDLPVRLLNVTVDIVPMTVLSLIMGYLHIQAGLVLLMINQRKLGKMGELFTSGLSWFTIFLGGGAMLAAKLNPWMQLEPLFICGSVVLGIGLFLLVLLPAILYKKRWFAGLGKGLYALYGATSYLGDFVSYTRLMALGVAGGSVALAFNSIIAFLPPVARFTLGILLAIVLHGLNIFLTMLSAYVHGIRLQFIEFFGKFYTGGGEGFAPFKAAEKHIIIVDPIDENS